MARAMEINLRLSGAQQAAQQLQSVADATRKVADQQQQAQRVAAQAPRVPFTPVQRAQQRVAQAQFFGDAAQQEHAELSLARAQRAQDRARKAGQPASFESRLETFVRSTRFGEGVSPLIGRTLDLLPAQMASKIGPLLGPIGIAAAGVAVAFEVVQRAGEALGTAIGQATARAIEFSSALSASGGTGRNVAALGAYGVPTHQIAAAAQALRDRLSSDPIAIAFSRTGMLAPGAHGPTNQAEILQREIENLRTVGQTQGPEAQLRTARALGLEAFLDMANTSNRVWNEVQADIRAVGQVWKDQALVQSVRDIQASARRLQQQGDLLRLQFARPFIAPMERLLAKLADAERGLSGLLDPQTTDPAGQAIQAAGGVLVGGLLNALGLSGFAKALMDNTNATNQNAQATKRNTAAMTPLPGISGGGVNAANFMPSALKGYAFQRGLVGNAIRLGAFNL